MTRGHQVLNLTGVFLPFVGVLVAIVLLWDTAVGWTSLAVLARDVRRQRDGRDARLPSPAHPPFVRDLQTGAVRARDPRLDGGAGPGHELGRRSPQAPRPHRPGGRPAHAPRPRRGFKGAVIGLWYAHMGWLFERSGHERAPALLPRPLRGPRHAASSTRRSALWVVLGIAIPAAIGLAITGTWRGAFEAALWGGAVRVFLGHHVTWSINSVCHFFGTRRFAVEDHSTNVFWLVAALDGRVLAPQPPHVPAQRLPRPQELGDRPDGPG